MSCSSHPINLFNWWLVSTPLKNMKVSWDYYSQSMESHKIHVPNHHPTDHFGWIPQLRHIPGAVSILGMLQNESDIPNISFFFQPFFIQADGIDIDITRCSQFITLFNACCLTDLGFADPENPKKHSPAAEDANPAGWPETTKEQDFTLRGKPQARCVGRRTRFFPSRNSRNWKLLRPSGKHTIKLWKIHHFSWENPL